MMIRRIVWVLAAATLALAAQTINPALYSGINWRMAGTFRAGRTDAVAGNAHQLDTYYMGAVDGGVWKSNNDGTTWVPIFDHEPVPSIGAIAVAPSNPDVIYVGTGEDDPRSQFSEGDGMFKSTDGGTTWTRIGLEPTRQIGRIVVAPNDPNRVYVAALGNAYAATPERGVYRSTDGGQTWQKVLFTNDNTGAIDLSLDPSNPQVIYAALWATRRPPWTVYPSSHEPGSGLYKSADGGSTWTHLTSGLPADPGRIGVAVAPADPNRVYAMVDAGAKDGGLYRSDDAGATWKLMDNENRIWNRGWYFESITVDPKDENTLYAINTTVYKSTDGGASFDAFRGAPGGDDYHQLWINPSDDSHMVLASDQGTIVTVNGGKSWSSWNNQPTAQLYDVTTDNRDPYWIYGAQQDSNNNGGAAASAGPNGGRATFGTGWTGECAAGESGGIAADPLATEELYGGEVSKCTPSTGKRESISPLVAYPGQYFRKTWTLPLAFSMADKHELFFANQFLFETDNGGAAWRKISPDLTRENPGVPSNLDPATANDTTYGERANGPRWGVIYSIGPSPLQPHEIWAGTDDGYIQVTGNDGQTWQNVTPPELTPWSKVIKIKASHYNPEEAFAAVDRHRLNDNRPYIYRTTDGGKTWTNIVNGIPDNQYLESLTEDPVRKGLLYCGTNRGVYVSFDNGNDWQSLRLNMPPVEIRGFAFHGKALVIATFGRSFWVMDDISPLRQVNVSMNDAPAVLYKPEPAAIPNGSSRSYGGSDPAKEVAQLDPMLVISADAPPSGAVIHYYLRADSGPVTLEILNSAGQVVRQYSSTQRVRQQNPKTMVVAAVFAQTPPVLSAAAGSHEWSWDFREVKPGAATGGRGGFGRGGGGGQGAAPGMYTVRLLADGHQYTQPLTVTLAPGATYTAEAAQQQQLAAQAQALAAQVARARSQAAHVRSQLTGLESQASGSLAASLRSLNEQVRAIEGYAAEPPNPDASGEGDATPAPTSLTGLTGILGQLAGAAQTAPYATAEAGFAKAKVMAEAQLAKWNQLKTTQLTALNGQLQHANLAPITLTGNRR
ncbi:MAG: WD40/YVTN/BNR-like repeat-containing protein [Terriglobales bacterium]